MSEKIDTSPLRTASGAVVQDACQLALDAARAAYRKEYDRGYVLSMTGRDEAGQRVLDRASARLLVAERIYAKTRGRK